MAKISLNSMKALLCVSAALIATNCLAGQDVFNGAKSQNTEPIVNTANISISNADKADKAVKIAEGSIDYKAVHLFSVYHKAMMDKSMMAQFEGLRDNTNIIPSITLEGLNSNTKTKILELHFNDANADVQVLNYKSVLLKAKDKTPKFFQNSETVSSFSISSVAQAFAMPESMVDANLKDSHEKIQCLVTVNASHLSKEHAIYKEVFSKSLNSMSSDLLDTVVAQFIVRHENAHCAQTGELYSTLALNIAGIAKEIQKDFATPYNQKFFKDIQQSIKNNSDELKSASYDSKLNNWVGAVKLFKSAIPEKIAESYADSISLLSLYSQGLINIQTIKDFAQERARASHENLDEDHDTSKLLITLAQKLESQQLQIPRNSNLKSIAKIFTPLWENYAGQEESKVGLTQSANASVSVSVSVSVQHSVKDLLNNNANKLHGGGPSNFNNTNSVNQSSFKHELDSKIAKIRQAQETNSHGHNHGHGPRFKH